MGQLQPGQKDRIVGEAHNVQFRQEAGEKTGEAILTFRVERYDRDGNRLQPVPVEMRSYSITGFINESDQVRVSGKWQGGLLQAKLADNLTTGAVIEAKSLPAVIRISCLVLFFIFAGTIVILAILAFLGVLR